MTSKQNKQHLNVISAGSTIAVALLNVAQQWWSRRWNALWRTQTTANQLNHAVVLTPHTSEKHLYE